MGLACSLVPVVQYQFRRTCTRSKYIFTIAEIGACTDKTSVFLNGSRVLSQERSVTTIDTKDTIRDISNLKYDWVSATLLLVFKGVHDELRSMAVTYLSNIHITSRQEIFRKLKYQQIKDMKFSRFRGSVTKHGQTGNLNILQVFLA